MTRRSKAIAHLIINNGLSVLENELNVAEGIDPEHGGPTMQELDTLEDRVEHARLVAELLRKFVREHKL